VAATFQANGSLLATGDSHGVVKLWDWKSGRELRSFLRHTNSPIEALAFTASDLQLISAEYDGVTRWDITTGVHSTIFRTPSKEESLIGISPHARFFATLAETHRGFRIWRVHEKFPYRTFRGHEQEVLTVAFGFDGRLLASGAADGQVIVWDLVTGEAITRFHEHAAAVETLMFAHNGSWLLSGSLDGTVVVYDIATRSKIFSLRGHGSGVAAIAYNPNDDILAAASLNGYVSMWKLGAEVQMLSLSGYKPYTITDVSERKIVRHWGNVAFSPDSRWFAFGDELGGVRVLDVPAFTIVQKLSGSPGSSGGGAFSPDGHWLALPGPPEAALKIWELSTGRELRIASPGRLGKIAFSPDGRHLASVASVDRQLESVIIWDLTTRHIVRTLHHRSIVVALAYSPDGQTLVTGGGYWMNPSGSDLSIHVWDVKRGHEIRILSGHTDVVTSLVFSPDGRILASGSNDNTIRLWDTKTGAQTATLNGTRRINKLVFSPDGHWLAAAEDSTVRIWDTEKWTYTNTIPAQTPYTLFSLDSSLIFIGSPTGSIRAFNPLSGQEAITLKQDTMVTGMSFHPGGRLLASFGAGEGVQIWDPWAGNLLLSLHSITFEDPKLIGEPQQSLTVRSAWLVISPDGLFDGSPPAWNRILWRFGGNTFDIAPVEAFFNEFYYPGLLAEVVSGKRPRAPRDFTKLDRRQPKVSITLDPEIETHVACSNRKIRVIVGVKEAAADSGHARGSGARDVRLFRNGSLVRVWRGDVLQGKQTIELQATVSILAGENRFTAYAFNRDNIKSADAALIVTGQETLRKKGIAYILAIGINDYGKTDYDLKYAVADARVFADELAIQQNRLGAFESVKIISLFDRDATKANILLALRRLSGGDTGLLPPDASAAIAKIVPAEPEDVVFIYYAGHGTAHGSHFYFVPRFMGRQGSSKEPVETDTVLDRAISDGELEQEFEPIDAGRLVLIIDACRSGQALETEEKRRGPMNSKGLAQLAYEKGMDVLTAAQGYQAALEASKLGHGLLTYALVEEGLKTPAADTEPRDGQVEVREWLDYATTRVPQLQESYMQEARSLGREVSFVDGEESIKDLAKRSLQHPRVFYRREPESEPLIIAQVAAVETTQNPPKVEELKPRPAERVPSRSGKFHLVQEGGPGVWSVNYEVTGRYEVNDTGITIRVDSGSARMSDSSRLDSAKLTGLQIGICSDVAGHWGIDPRSTESDSIVKFDHVLTQRGPRYTFPSATLHLTIPDGVDLGKFWICGLLRNVLSNQVGFYPAADVGRKPIL